MLRRAASGHIKATQLSKFAAASRIALAVIRGWPEAPSSPLHGSGPLPVACDGAGAPGWADGAVCAFLEKMLPRKSSGLLEDCARASPQNNSAAARRTAPVRTFADRSAGRTMFHPHPFRITPLSGGPVPVSNSLTKAGFLR